MKRVLAFAHRWLGVATCLLFCLWFASGLVMIYVPFPFLKVVETTRSLPAIDMARVNVSPVKAIKTAATDTVVDSLTLQSQRLGGAAYRVGHANALTLVDAQTGNIIAPINAREARQVGVAYREAYGQETIIDEIVGPIDYDQWVVYGAFDPYRPFYRIRFDDPKKTELYVSATTQDIVQETTRSERNWNRVGAVVHWIYFTNIRKNWALWDALVWWLALICIVTALLGAFLGVVRLRHSKSSQGFARFTSFRGWMKWHHVLGVVVGVFVVSWILSGWLSMDHGRLFSKSSATSEQIARFNGLSVEEAASSFTLSELQALDAHSVDFFGRAGIPLLLVKGFWGENIGHAVQLFQHEPEGLNPTRLEDDRISKAVRAGWPEAAIDSIEPLDAYDPYVHLVEGGPPPGAVRVTLNDLRNTWIHVDPDTGSIISVMDESRRLYRWLYNGLHSFDFPFLSRRPILRDALLTIFCLAGFLFSLTGLVLGVRKLNRSWSER